MRKEGSLGICESTYRHALTFWTLLTARRMCRKVVHLAIKVFFSCKNIQNFPFVSRGAVQPCCKLP